VKVGDLDIAAIDRRLAGAGMSLSVGRFDFRIRTRLPGMGAVLRGMYEAYPLPSDDAILDFVVTMESAGRRHRWFGDPLANFHIDGVPVREPFLRSLAWAHTEWAANYAFGTRTNQYLLIHAAVVERDGGAVALPGHPGAGKSTLTAALVARGWRFLSDEFLIIDPANGDLIPFPRPISLKERSIDIIRARAPEAVFSPMFEGTHKGLVSYMRVPDASVSRALEPARLRWVVYPLYEAGAGLVLEPKSKARAFLEMADNAFNYQIRGELAFDDLRHAFEPVQCFDLRYDDLDAAIAALEALP